MPIELDESAAVVRLSDEVASARAVEFRGFAMLCIRLDKVVVITTDLELAVGGSSISSVE